jgi:hypothetical protein
MTYSGSCNSVADDSIAYLYQWVYEMPGDPYKIYTMSFMCSAQRPKCPLAYCENLSCQTCKDTRDELMLINDSTNIIFDKRTMTLIKWAKKIQMNRDTTYERDDHNDFII